jgi:hypothetical protein
MGFSTVTGTTFGTVALEEEEGGVLVVVVEKQEEEGELYFEAPARAGEYL